MYLHILQKSRAVVAVQTQRWQQYDKNVEANILNISRLPLQEAIKVMCSLVKQ